MELDEQQRQKALKIGANIMREFELTKEECEILWSQNEDQLITVSRLLSVYQSLRTLFIAPDSGAAWIRKDNQAFEGRPAVDVMLRDDAGLEEVQRYLLAQCNS